MIPISFSFKKWCPLVFLPGSREDRVCCTKGDDFVTCNTREDDIKRLLRDELEVYSYQFKQAATVFGKGQVALSGKVRNPLICLDSAR